MKFFVKFILLIIIHLCVSAEAFDSNAFGTFTGVVSHDNLGKDQLVKLELIPEREIEGGMKLQAILTLQFGGYDSTEYVSYHYHDIAFNLLSGILTLNETNQEVYIKDAVLKGNIFEGILYSSSGQVGFVRLSKANDILPTQPLIEPLNGEYRGKCGKTPSSLQLFTYRSTNDSSRLGNPYGAYEAKGQFAKRDKVLCAGETKKFCTFSKVSSVSYDFFNGSLGINGDPLNYTCTVNGNKITCGDCQLQRVSNEMQKSRLQQKVDTKDLRKELIFSKSSNTATESSIAGVYNGYLYHENLSAYQRVQIELSTYQQQTPNGLTLMISAIARLQFGETQNEILAYKFAPTPFPNPLKKTYFILARPDADVDALLQVTDLEKGIISGRWHSIIFGKVGSFVATKNENLPEIKNPVFLKQVSAVYEEKGASELQDLILELNVLRDRGPLNSDNPFIPLNIKGWIWRRSGLTEKDTIATSSYDFYTGRVALLYGKDKVVTGLINLTSGSPAKLRRLGGDFGTFMQSFDLVPFRKKP